MLKKIALTLVLMSVLSLIACQTQAPFECTDPLGCVTIPADQPLVLGDIHVRSGNETLQLFGTEIARGVELAVTNRDSALLGHPITVLPEDEACSEEGGANAAFNLVTNEQVVGIIGPICSGAGIGAAPVVSEAGGVIISPNTLAPDLTSLDGQVPAENNHLGYFRAVFNGTNQAQAAAHFAYEELGITRASTLSDRTAFPSQIAQAFEARFIELGGEIVQTARFSVEEGDYQPLIDSLVQRPSPLLFITTRAQTIPIMELGHAQEVFDDMVLLNTDTMFVAGYLESFADLNQPLYLTIPAPVLSAAGQAIVEQYEQVYGEPPIRARFLNAYDATNLLLDKIENIAVQEADGTLHIGRQVLRDALYATQDYLHLLSRVERIVERSTDGFCTAHKLEEKTTVFFRKIQVLALFVLMSLLACQTEAQFECTDPLGCVTITPNEPIKLGSLHVLSGLNAPFGEEMARGVELAVLNREAILGHPIEIQLEDESCSEEGGANSALKLMADEQLVAIVGPTCSGAAVGASPIVSEAGSVLVAPNPLAPDLTSLDGRTEAENYHPEPSSMEPIKPRLRLVLPMKS